MGEEPRAIEEHIRQEREALDRDITELEQRYRRVTDWRSQIRQRPGVIIALGFGVGVLGSMALPANGRKSRRHEQDYDRELRPRQGLRDSQKMSLLHGLQGALVSALTHQVKEHFAKKKEERRQWMGEYPPPPPSGQEERREAPGGAL